MDLWNLDEGWVSGIWESQFTECREIPFEYETVIDNVPLLNSVLVDVSDPNFDLARFPGFSSVSLFGFFMTSGISGFTFHVYI